jgi:Uncharacterized proteins of the AP superfamily
MAALRCKSGAKAYRKLGAKADKSYFDAIERTPFGNDIVEQFAEAAVAGEHLGEDEIPDLLAVSFSANDRIGHQLGPDSPEVRDVSIQTDRTLGRLFKFLDDKVGADNYVVVLTGDHGVAPLPEIMQQRKMPGGRMTEESVLSAIQGALVKAMGRGNGWSANPAPHRTELSG